MTALGGRPLHQVLVAAAPGDAVTTCALQIRAGLRNHGPSEIFACHIHPALWGDVHTLAEYAAHVSAPERELTIAHVSMGDAGFVNFVLGLPGRLVLSYHNVTPSRFFAPWSPKTAELLELGRRCLVTLRDRTALAMADSAFNAAELTALGYLEVRVAGLVVATDELLDVPADHGVLERSSTFRGPLVMSVGQLYPHKRLDLILAAFHVLLTNCRPDAHLVLAGAARLPGYDTALKRYVDRLGLAARTTVTGEIPLAELVAWYRSADLFVIASEHEGFCVPLVEAMTFNVPVLARANAAVPETVDDAGILVPGDTGPTAFGWAMAALLDDKTACDELRRRGQLRRQVFAPAASVDRVLAALAEVM